MLARRLASSGASRIRCSYQFLSVTPTQIFMFAQDALRTLAFHRLFEEETFRQERRSDVLDVLRRYAADVEMVSPSSDSRYDFVDFYSGRLDAESEALALGKQVVDARRASISSDRHREVAAFEADQRHRHEIVCRRQAPAMRAAARRMVARMIVVVRHSRVEDDAPK